MGVAVQLMVDAEVSGVLFTCNPVSGDPSMVAVNASWGLGLAVVGGEVTPDDYLVSKITREVVRRHVHAKDIEYVPDADGRGAVRVDVPEERREVSCLDARRARRARRRRAAASSGTSARTRTSSGQSHAAGVPASLFVAPVAARDGDARPAGRRAAASAMALVMSAFGVARERTECR